MRKSVAFEGLTHIVRARGATGGWYTIAAFDVKSIANDYARECREYAKRARLPFRYLVRKVEG